MEPVVVSCATTQIRANGWFRPKTAWPEIDPPMAITAVISLVVRPEPTLTVVADCSVALSPYHWLPYLARLQSAELEVVAVLGADRRCGRRPSGSGLADVR